MLPLAEELLQHVPGKIVTGSVASLCAALDNESCRAPLKSDRVYVASSLGNFLLFSSSPHIDRWILEKSLAMCCSLI